MTPVGDPPNVIIATNRHVIANVSTNLLLYSTNFAINHFSFILIGRELLLVHHAHVSGHIFRLNPNVFAITFHVSGHQ